MITDSSIKRTEETIFQIGFSKKIKDLSKFLLMFDFFKCRGQLLLRYRGFNIDVDVFFVQKIGIEFF